MNSKPSFETTPLSLSKIEDNSIPSLTWSTQLESEYFCQNYIAKFWKPGLVTCNSCLGEMLFPRTSDGFEEKDSSIPSRNEKLGFQDKTEKQKSPADSNQRHGAWNGTRSFLVNSYILQIDKAFILYQH